MSHVVIPNQSLFASNEEFNVIWKLSRGLLAAGWKYKASADGVVKEATGNSSLDRWAVGGGVNLTSVSGQSGTAPTFGAPSSGASTITGLTGMSATLSPGRVLTFAGAVNAGNNGSFRIVSWVSATSVVIFNPSAVAETGIASTTWTEQQGGALASVFATGTAGAIPGRAVLTGLTGMVAPTTAPLNRGSVGDRITIINATTGANNGTFMITRVISATSVEINNASAVTDANNGALIWVEVSPTAQVYATHLQGATGLGAWINLQGPSTMKIPVGANFPTGTFVKGESVTQTLSGATGVILGLCLDTDVEVGETPDTEEGYIVVEPRLNGTGGGVRGWSIVADTITGAISGATIVTPVTLPPVEYVHELVFWKNSATNGHCYAQCVDSVGELSARFSTLATGATATICPGGATGTFPTPGSWVYIGTGGSNVASTGSNIWLSNSTVTNLGLSHIICANNIEGAATSMDGSWIATVGQPSSSPTNYTGIAFMRCDDGEEGDVSPYVTWAPSNTGWFNMTNSSRTNMIGNSALSGDMFRLDTYVGGGAFSPYKGFRRRGFPTGDAYSEFAAFVLGSGTNTLVTGTLVGNNSATPGKVATQATSNQFVREPIWIINVVPTLKMRKGTLRWMLLTEGGVTNNTYANGTWVQLGTSNNGPVVVGPWDGQTVPTNG